MTKILVVEASLIIAKSLSEFLHLHGYQTKYCTSTNNTVDNILEFNPHLVLLDFTLPEVDGLRICKNIRTFSDVPIIFMSQQANRQQRLQTFSSGADDFIEKPFNSEELLLRIKSVLKRCNTRTQRQIQVS